LPASFFKRVGLIRIHATDSLYVLFFNEPFVANTTVTRSINFELVPVICNPLTDNPNNQLTGLSSYPMNANLNFQVDTVVPSSLLRPSSYFGPFYSHAGNGAVSSRRVAHDVFASSIFQYSSGYILIGCLNLFVNGGMAIHPLLEHPNTSSSAAR